MEHKNQSVEKYDGQTGQTDLLAMAGWMEAGAGWDRPCCMAFELASFTVNPPQIVFMLRI